MGAPTWQRPKTYQHVNNQMIQRSCNHITIVESTIPNMNFVKYLCTKWTGASNSIKTSSLARMTFGRSCKKNGTTLRWKLHIIKWNQCPTNCTHCWRQKDNSPNTSPNSKQWYKMNNKQTTFLHMFCNVVQRGSCVLEHNNVKSIKSNATPQICIFTMWIRSPWKSMWG